MTKKKLFSTIPETRVTHWVDDFDVYRWDIALTRKALLSMSREDYDRFLGAFKTIGDVLKNAPTE